ncbi:MAG: cyclic nucleotide-binding domain-containing protein [bacterium]|nr:cyclic nucleotide-binding domain-containing protein [bacterium]
MLVDFPLIVEIGEKYIDLITKNACVVRFNPGEAIVQAGDDADRFFLIQQGEVAIETYAPERGPIIVQTIGEGEMVGWSWFLPPYRWHFDARAVKLTNAISVLAQPIRDLCEEDNDLGYRVNKYISQVIGQRMEATRMQLLDVFQK